MRERIIKKYGNSTAIKLDSTDLKDLKLKVGDFVIIDDIIRVKEDKNGKRN